MKLKPTKTETLFAVFAPSDCVLTDDGLTQFRAKQSSGVTPDVADECYTLLMRGKQAFELEQETLRRGFFGLAGGQWFGVHQLCADWGENRLWIVRELLRWANGKIDIRGET